MSTDEKISARAAHCVESMEVIASDAQDRLSGRRASPQTGDVFASRRSQFTDEQGERAEAEIVAVRTKSSGALVALARRPLLARVVVRDEEDGSTTDYLLVPATPTGSLSKRLGALLLSVATPRGRVGELPIGEETDVRVDDLGNERTLTVIERVRVRPVLTPAGWDGLSSWYESIDRRVTIPSLRQLADALRVDEEELGELLGSLLAGPTPGDLIEEGFRRPTLRRLGLQDHSVLDQFQGEVFRLPIQSKLVLLGPAGTGKTTTLIMRIAQKLLPENLFQDEKRALALAGGREPLEPSNWVMFTPTDLLKHYLKEAFAREGVVASDQRVRVWAGFRRHLGRDVLGILPTQGSRRLVMRDDVALLLKTDSRFLQDHFEAFDEWLRKDGVARLAGAAAAMSDSGDETIARLGAGLSGRLTDEISVEDLIQAVSALGDLKGPIAALRDEIQRAVNSWAEGLLRLNRDSFDRLGDYLDELDAEEAAAKTAEDEDEEEDEDELDAGEALRGRTQTARQLAFNAYRRAMYSWARSVAAGRKIGERSSAARIVAWLDDRVPPRAELRQLGRSLGELAALRRVDRPSTLFVDRAATRYRSFRGRLLTAEDGGPWFRPEMAQQARAGSIQPEEVDTIILAMTRNARRIISAMPRHAIWQESLPGKLEAIRDEWLTQVFVDEATDFSAVQLACMAELAHPRLQSVFACGDLRQRLTGVGVQSIDGFRWAIPGVTRQSIDVSYRQSKKLGALANRIAALNPGPEGLADVAFGLDHEGVPAVLSEGRVGDDLAEWITARIVEIDTAERGLPTVALFVDGEAEVEPLEKLLAPLLTARNIDVRGCPRGETLGDEGTIRIFDVQHIKGLEFEAVFFVGIDRLADRVPDLLDKYLYVGATRAVTYLGIAADTMLPAALDSLREDLVDGDWA